MIIKRSTLWFSCKNATLSGFQLSRLSRLRPLCRRPRGHVPASVSCGDGCASSKHIFSYRTLWFHRFPMQKPPVAYSGDRRFLVVFSVSRSSVYLLITFYPNSHFALCFHHSAASNSRFLAILETFCLIFALQESLVASIIGCHSKARHVYERIFDNPSNKTA